MAGTNLRKKDDAPGSTLGEVRGYARRIWLAGLGAYSRVGQESSDYLEELVKAGEGVERRGKREIDHTIEAANNQIDEATRTVSRLPARVESRIARIERAFDARVGRALNRFGIPSKPDVESLSIKLEELTALLERVERKR